MEVDLELSSFFLISIAAIAEGLSCAGHYAKYIISFNLNSFARQNRCRPHFISTETNTQKSCQNICLPLL